VRTQNTETKRPPQRAASVSDAIRKKGERQARTAGPTGGSEMELRAISVIIIFRGWRCIIGLHRPRSRKFISNSCRCQAEGGSSRSAGMAEWLVGEAAGWHREFLHGPSRRAAVANSSSMSQRCLNRLVRVARHRARIRRGRKGFDCQFPCRNGVRRCNLRVRIGWNAPPVGSVSPQHSHQPPIPRHRAPAHRRRPLPPPSLILFSCDFIPSVTPVLFRPPC